jgi:hypothetical protein
MIGIYRTLKGGIGIKYPRICVKLLREWGFSFRRYSLVLSEDTTTPYSILHIGPFELFIVPRVQFII